MQKVLLAIDSMTPSQKLFHYALQLCQRMKAELSLLQVVGPRSYREYFTNLQKGTNQAKRYFEGSMVAATYAEAGEHEMAKELRARALENLNQLLPETEKAGVPCHVSMVTGDADKEISSYVKNHRDVILAIYDTSQDVNRSPVSLRKKSCVPTQIRQNLSIPLVVMRSAS